MNKKEILALTSLGIILGLILPTEIFATSTDVYGAKAISKIGDKLKTFMFEVAVPYTGGIFGGINTIKSFMSNNYQAMGMFALLTAYLLLFPPQFFTPEFASHSRVDPKIVQSRAKAKRHDFS